VILSKEDVLKYFIYDSERLDYTGRSNGIYLKRKAFSFSNTDYYVEKYKDLNNQNIWLPIWSLSDVDNKNGRGNYEVCGGERSYIPNIGSGHRDQDLFYCRPAIWVNINSINNSKTKSILGDNVNIEGIDVWQNQDGTIQIGGTQEAGAKLIQSGSSNDGRIAGLPSRESELRSDDHFYLDDSMQRNTWVYYVTYYYHVDGKGNIEKSKWITGAIVNSNGDTMTVKRYVGEDGRMYRGRQTPDGKWVGNDGLLVDVGNDLSTSLTIEAAEPDSWYKTQSGLWYYFENDRTTTKKGWFTDTRDNQTYYLDPQTGIMAIGWTKISGNEYYFNELQAEDQNWYETGGGFYESYGKKIKALGSMYKNETTPDGKKVDANGKLIK
ncbi:MAG: hypothetical protein II411_03810, partial [Lachnospiraceae bacterium]|nr:hypothetical protein [Lachnospiraceae bacterium]